MTHDFGRLRRCGAVLQDLLLVWIHKVGPDPTILSEQTMRDYFKRAGLEADRLAHVPAAQALEGGKHFLEERIRHGWRRTDPAMRYQPDEPKLFYAYQSPANNDDIKHILETIRRSLPWRTARGQAAGPQAWTLTHATSVARKEMLGMEPMARGFRARRELELGAVTMDVFAFMNRISPHAAEHHLVVGLEFDQPDRPRMRWHTPQSEQCVATAVSTLALAPGLRNIREFSLEKGGWRHVPFDIPYRADYLQSRGTLDKTPP